MSDHIFDFKEKNGPQAMWAYQPMCGPRRVHFVLMDDEEPYMNLDEEQVRDLIVALQEWLAKREGMG